MKIFTVGLSTSSLFELALAGYSCFTYEARDAEELLQAIDAEQCEALILRTDNIACMCDAIVMYRKKGLRIPIIGISLGLAQDWSRLRTRFLDVGGDDLLRNPDTSEIDASVRAIIRRLHGRDTDESRFTYNNTQFCVNTRSHMIWVNGKMLNLTGKERKVFMFLVEELNTLRSARAISENLYDGEINESWNRIEVFVTRIRKKLNAMEAGAAGIVQNLRGLGYRVSPD